MEREGGHSRRGWWLVAGAAEARGADGNRVLVVDDSESVRTMMEVKRQAAGYRVDFAHTGEDGLKMAIAHCFDLIFVDVVLPGMNGYDVWRRLERQVRVACPVVLLTSKSSRIDRFGVRSHLPTITSPSPGDGGSRCSPREFL